MIYKELHSIFFLPYFLLSKSGTKIKICKIAYGYFSIKWSNDLWYFCLMVERNGVKIVNVVKVFSVARLVSNTYFKCYKFFCLSIFFLFCGLFLSRWYLSYFIFYFLLLISMYIFYGNFILY